MESPAFNEAVIEDPDDEVENLDPLFDGDSELDEDERIIKEIKTNVKKAKDHLQDWYNEARNAYDYFAGNQWEEEDLQKLRNERRPAIVFNRIPRVINAIAGLEIENRQEVIYSPREQGDAIASEILTGAADWVRNNCDAEDEESQAFKDALMVGIGWTETRLEYEVDPDGAILIERIDPMEMVWDVTSKKRNLDDATWVAREKKYTKKDFKAIWPDADVDMLTGAQDPRGLQPHDATLAPWYLVDQSSKDQRQKDFITVTQYQKWLRVPFYRVQDDENEITEMDAKEFKKLKELIDMRGFKYIKQIRRVFKQYFVAGEQMLEKGDCPINMFTLRAMTGMLDRNRNYWFGMISIMRDPQMWANKWLSQTLHIFNSNAKGGYFAEAGAFKDPRQAENSLAQSTVTYLNEGGLAMVQKKEAPQFPQGIDGLLQYAISSVSELVGVSLESLGQEKSDVSGVLAAERKRTTITIVADFFDALRRYRKESGRVLADFIISYISDGRLVRIAGPGLGKYVPLVKEQMDFTYDIIVDDTPTSPNQKERVFATLMQLMPQLQEAGIPFPPEILEFAPLPASLIRDWQKLIEEQKQAQAQDQSEQLKEQVRMQLAQLEAAKMQQDIMNKKADEVETKTKSALNLAQMQKESALAQKDAHNASRDHMRKDVEVGLKLVQELGNDRGTAG
jgi:hypothetical protein